MSYQMWEAGFGYPPPAGPPRLARCEAVGADGVGVVSGPLDETGPDYAVTAMFREHHAELVRLAVLITGDRGAAEDIVQDVFARLCAKDYLPEPA
ncbi:MAG TPA: sigma factor, partial [Streptosporangiaceae bacterium]|nr:sigma factor [Streptosporangiaceae bacterium]